MKTWQPLLIFVSSDISSLEVWELVYFQLCIYMSKIKTTDIWMSPKLTTYLLINF